MFEDRKIVNILECVWIFIQKSWAILRQRKLIGVSLMEWTFCFWENTS